MISEIIIKFILGGVIIASITFLARIHPKYGGLIVVAPILTTAAIVLTYLELGAPTSVKTALFSIYFLVPLFLFLLTAVLTLEKVGLIPSLVCGYLIWLVSTLIIQHYVS